MSKTKKFQPKDESADKPLVWLHGEIKSPPFSDEARSEAGFLLRMLQKGEKLEMPQGEPVPAVGPRCGAIRVPDESHTWRIMYRVDEDAVLVLEVYSKKSRKIPKEVIEICRKRLAGYDVVSSTIAKNKK